MKNFILVILLVIVIYPIKGRTENAADKTAIETVIQTSYVDGLQNLKNIDAIADGFHSGFNLLMLQNGMLNKLPIYNWIEYAKQRKAKQTEPLKEEDTTYCKFLNIDITGTAAVAKIELNKGGKTIYIDYLSLYKFEDGWKIVGKIYFSVPPK